MKIIYVFLLQLLLFTGCNDSNNRENSAADNSNLEISAHSNITGNYSAGAICHYANGYFYDVGNIYSGVGEISGGSFSEPISLPQSDKVTALATDANASYFYFSYDDAASTAGVELSKYYLHNDTLPSTGWGRAYEFLNYEPFNNDLQEPLNLFNVSMGSMFSNSNETQKTALTIGVHLSSPSIIKEERKNIVLSILVDTSGSMKTQYAATILGEQSDVRSRMDLVRYGLHQLYEHSLKEGDIINIVQFSSDSTDEDILLEGWLYDDNGSKILEAVDNLYAGGSTNLNAGIARAYIVAHRTFDSKKHNRVLMMTDAYANTGEINPQMIANDVTINNSEGIYFSGLGIGDNFQEAFLNELTDIGKGAYFATITPTDMMKAFNERFIALILNAAKDVQFRFDFPSQLKHIDSAAEEFSIDPNDVQPTNFSYNSSQYFLETFKIENESTLSNEPFILTISYTDVNGATRTETFQKMFSEIVNKDQQNIRKGIVIKTLADLINEKITCDVFELNTLEQMQYLEDKTIQEYLQLSQAFCRLSKLPLCQ